MCKKLTFGLLPVYFKIERSFPFSPLKLLISSWTQCTGSWTGQFSRLLGVSIGEESFSDLDYADDVTLLAEMLETLVAGLLVLQDEAAPPRPSGELDKNEDPPRRGTTSDPVYGPGGSRERQLGGRVHLPWVADLTRWRKWGRNSATHWDLKGVLLPPWEEHLEVSYTHKH